MRRFLVLMTPLVILSCDLSRIDEQQVDFPDKAWMVNERPHFEFDIKDHTQNYNLYYTVRNSLNFPFSRLFVNYSLTDSVDIELRKDLLSAYLFNQKTGEPFGNSSIGDLFDHRFPIVTNYHFDKPGTYTITLEQFNRLDTLQGILAVGIRVETANNN